MWACYEPFSWLRSPEYAGAWCTFLLGVFLWLVAVRGRKSAVRFARRAAWAFGLQVAIVVGTLEAGRRMHRPNSNSNDLYVMASIALSVGWGVLLLLLVRFLLRRYEDEPKGKFEVGWVLLAAVGLLGALTGLAILLELSTAFVMFFAGTFSVTALEVQLIVEIALVVTVGWLCLSVEPRSSILLGASIGVMAGAVPIAHRLAPMASRTQAFALTDGCVADRFLFNVENGSAAKAMLAELSSRTTPRYATFEATLRALHRTLGTKERPGEYMLPEHLVVHTGESSLFDPEPYRGFPDAALLRVQVDRGHLSEPMAWMHDPMIDVDNRLELADYICQRTGSTSAACEEAKSALPLMQ